MSGFSQECANNATVATEHEDLAIALAGFKIHELMVYLVVTLFILTVMLLKIAYHKVPHLGSYLPESLLLILIGLSFGALIRYTQVGCSFASNLRLSPELFFNILLPPIMLESAYSIYNKKFAQILSTILLFAVVGTVLNFLFIGLGLYLVDITIGLGEPNLHFGLEEFLLFASLIVAVDPVAVLAIFQDIGVDLGLYYMVFGESLLNDAVTVVLYNIMSAFVASSSVTGLQIATGIGCFFTVSLGGALIGLVHGVFSCLLSRFNVVSETIGMLLMSYLAYLVADLFAWSGIISIVVCGVFQAAYAFHNLTPLSVMLLESAVEQMTAISEAIIFLLLGSEVFALNLHWHTGFIITSLVLCLVCRFIVVVPLAAIVNKNRSTQSRISWSEQIIISYGGLRGAVSFSLAILINAKHLGENSEIARNVLVTTALVVIFFTVAVMGTTIKPLVRLLNIRLSAEEKKQKSLFVTLNSSVMEESLLFVEELFSQRGIHSFVRALSDFDDKYVRPILQRDAATHDKKIVNIYEKMALKMHSEAISSHCPVAQRDSESGLFQLERSREPSDLGINILPALKFPHNEHSAKHQRRLTFAALSTVGPGAALVQDRHVDFAAAQRIQFAKFSRTQATLARTMDLYVKRQETLNIDGMRPLERGASRRGQLTRQFARCREDERSPTGSGKRRGHSMWPPILANRALTAMLEEEAELEQNEDAPRDPDTNSVDF